MVEPHQSPLLVTVMKERYVAERLGSFLGKIAYNYARYGYHWYAVREIPEGKDLGEVDRKIPPPTVSPTSCAGKGGGRKDGRM